jgi:hypothetical protein
VKDSVALDFMLDMLSVVITEKGSSAVLTLLKRSGLDSMLDQLFPTYLAGLENAGAKKDIQRSRSLPGFSSWSNFQLIEDLMFLVY